MKKILLLVLFAAFSVKMHAQCSAVFTYTANPSGTYTFVATGNNSSNVYYQWLLGNGSMMSGPTWTTQFNTTGNVTVCLVVTDTTSLNGCVDSSCQTITIGGTGGGCNANFNYSIANGAVSLNSTSTGQGTLSYVWYEGTNVFSTSSSAQYSNTPGTYTICLAISDGNGCSDTLCQNVTIPNPPLCQASFYIYPDSNGPAHTYIGVNTATGVGNNGSYLWIWGDGTTSTGPYPSHTYPAAGIYNICLVIGNPATGCVDSFCVSSNINKNTAMYTITFTAPTSLPSIETLEANLYPNPAKNSVSISGLKDGIYNIEVYDLQGSKVHQSQIANNGVIQINNFSKGLYAIKISDKEGRSVTKKIVKE